MSMMGPIIPLLAAEPNNPNSSIHLWHENPTNPNPNLRKPMPVSFPMLDSTTTATTIFNNPNSNHMVSSLTTTCQDCGNQAKKDCPYRRCRTCCKSRRFECSTHVKSTWVPAAKRRERQQLNATLAANSASTSGSKKPRLLKSTSNTTASHTSTSNTTPRSLDTTSSHQQDAGFRENLPWQVRAPAVFKCVRVTSIDDGEDEYAYQAMVNIGGHVFKGLLYDQGAVDNKDDNGADGDNHDNSHHYGGNSSNSTTLPNMSELHIGGGVAAGVPPDVYGGGSGSLMGGGGTTYG